MVCANDGKASVVGSSPQGGKPNSMKEEHIVIIVMLWEERIRGDKSKALGVISIPTWWEAPLVMNFQASRRFAWKANPET